MTPPLTLLDDIAEMLPGYEPRLKKDAYTALEALEPVFLSMAQSLLVIAELMFRTEQRLSGDDS